MIGAIKCLAGARTSRSVHFIVSTTKMRTWRSALRQDSSANCGNSILPHRMGVVERSACPEQSRRLDGFLVAAYSTARVDRRLQPRQSGLTAAYRATVIISQYRSG